MGDVGPVLRKKKLLKKAGLPRHVKDMSKEQLEATIRKKRECNAKALAIVEHMLEPDTNEEWFLDQLKFIDVGHFQDIIEERAVSKLCGYPLCNKNLKNIPSQQYRISTKYNKVYDITERKNFCSNECYKASKFVKDQLLTSPLWLRDREDIPDFQLLPLGSRGTGAGEEVDFGQNSNLKSEVNELSTADQFVSVADFAKGSLSQLSKKVSELELRESQTPPHVDRSSSGPPVGGAPHASEDAPPAPGCELQHKCGEGKAVGVTVENKVSPQVEIRENPELESCRNLNIESDSSQVTVESQHENNDSSTSGKKTLGNSRHRRSDEKVKSNRRREEHKEKENASSSQHHENSELTSYVIQIEKCLHEWFTIETMCFLLGDKKVRDLVSDKGECIKEYYKAVGRSSWDPVLQERYEALCRKVNIMEMQEDVAEREEQEQKPLPEYSVLKEESLNMDLKIKAFFKGKTDYEMSSKPVGAEGNGEYAPSCVLPLTDMHAQNALRRRMVLDNLKRVLPDLLRTLSLTSRDISSDVRNLVATFSLSAHNITFKPAEWNLLGLIIIKMLSIKDIRLKTLLETQQGIKCQTMLLMAFQQDGGYLERLMIWLTDLDNIMKKNI